MIIDRFRQEQGLTLIELVIVIVLAGVITAVAVREMSTSVETAKHEKTKSELEQLAQAIVGNPEAYSSGARSNFGYVGDIGALPPNLTALVENPGGYTTWAGPYVSRGFSDDDFTNDAWQTAYVYTDTLLRSTGSGVNIDKVFASSTSSLLSNTIRGYVMDANHSRPGMTYKDSVLIEIVYPDGAGDWQTDASYPSADGSFSFGGIPIGNHTLRVISIPRADTMIQSISVAPSSSAWIEMTFPADLWL